MLLVVAHEVLDAGGHTLRLDASNPCRCDGARQKRILGEALEVAPGIRHPGNVDGGTEKYVGGLGASLVRKRAAHFLDQRWRPRGAHRCADRKARGCRPVVAVGASSPVGTVGHLESRDTGSPYRRRVPHVTPGKQQQLLVECQLRQRDAYPVAHWTRRS